MNGIFWVEKSMLTTEQGSFELLVFGNFLRKGKIFLVNGKWGVERRNFQPEHLIIH